MNVFIGVPENRYSTKTLNMVIDEMKAYSGISEEKMEETGVIDGHDAQLATLDLNDDDTMTEKQKNFARFIQMCAAMAEADYMYLHPWYMEDLILGQAVAVASTFGVRMIMKDEFIDQPEEAVVPETDPGESPVMTEDMRADLESHVDPEEFLKGVNANPPIA